MASIDEAVTAINSAGDDLILLHSEDIHTQTLYLVKKVGEVSHDEGYFHGLSGLALQMDSDSNVYTPSFCENTVFLLDGYGIDSESLFEFRIGRKSMVEYLQSINHWDAGIDFRRKELAFMAALYVCTDNKLK